MDQELRWKPQVDNAIARGTAYVFQLRRLSSTAKGIPLQLMRQLYQAIAVPKMLYAADLWFSPVYREGTDKLQRGSVGVAKHISSVQRIAALAITGALRSTATDILEAHANLLPATLLLQNACYRATIRLTTHPKTHPLYHPLRRAASKYVSSHRSSLHKLTHRYAIVPDDIETLIPSRRSPSSSNPWTTHIATSKADAITEHENLTDVIQVYSNGSRHQGKVGAAATLFRVGKPPRTLKFHLGADTDHTVFEAEEVGLTLAAKLIATERRLTFPISISVDNQATIQAGESFYTRPGSYLADHFRRMMRHISKRHTNFAMTLRWVPGHSGIHGNEEVDKHAKAAAEDRHNCSPTVKLPKYLRSGTLPLSVSALKEVHQKDTHSRWERLWRKSPRYNRMHQLDPKLLQRSFVKLTSTFPK